MNKYNIFYCLISLLFFSCDGMNDNIKQYLDAGEINYIGRVDSVVAAGGNERLQLTWKVNVDPRIEACKVYWNNQEDSVVFPIDRNLIVNGRFSAIMDNMKEGTYIFNLQHIGSKGYPSVLREAVGTVYGELYQASIAPRRIKEVVPLKEQVEIEWQVSDAGLQSVTLYYMNKDGIMKNLEIPGSEDKTIITDYLQGGEYYYETYYLPSEHAIDIFKVKSGVRQFPFFYEEFDRKDWKVIYCSSEVPSAFPVSNILDGETSTIWHSTWEDPVDPLPHIITIDMQTEKNIGKINIIRDSRRYTKLILLHVSSDNDNWTQIGNIRYPDQVEHGGILALSEPVKGRYLRLTMTESFLSPSCELAEVYVYGNE